MLGLANMRGTWDLGPHVNQPLLSYNAPLGTCHNNVCGPHVVAFLFFLSLLVLEQN